jgi:ribosomal protein S12 methylthiotransferase
LKKFYFISLGCAKTRVDSEYMVAILENDSFEKVKNIEEADYIFVNTCSFIEDARVESIDTILNIADKKDETQKLIVAGCLPQRYKEDIVESFPEVSHFIGTSHIGKVLSIINSEEKINISEVNESWIPQKVIKRKSSISLHSAYLKIAEGCDKKCAFCAVPIIRGKQKSIQKDILISEAKSLVSNGIKEINLVAQDLSSYGKDIGTNLLELLKELNDIDGVSWLRVLYLYPSDTTKKMLKDIFSLEKVVPYLDIPIQHSSSKILKVMKRGYNEEKLKELLGYIKEELPNLFLRTTILVGHPGEGEEEFNHLVEFLKEYKFDHLGVFAYSPEEDTVAFKLEHVSRETAEKRKNIILDLQKNISLKKQTTLIGKTMPVLIDEYDEENMILTGRHSGQAPEIDGKVYLSKTTALPGDIIKIKITDSADYDLVGEPVDEN